MARPRRPLLDSVLIVAMAAAPPALLFNGCACHLSAPRSLCVQSNAEGPLPVGTPRLCLEKPLTLRSPAVLILYATGDAGWFGTSKGVYRHLVERGYPVVGISARDYLKKIDRKTESITPDRLARDLSAIIVAAKADLDLPAATPTILVGISRGAGFMVVAAAQQAIQPRPYGAVALSLTRETDFVRNRRVSKVQAAAAGASTMESGQVLTYARLKGAYDIPIAVLQSTNDRYLPAEDARKLFGPDTGSRRFRAVEARNHAFGGALETVFRELDESLNWIESFQRPAVEAVSLRP
jgi:pimeloyl-ACP methyl ester carboxylesterase